MRGVVFVFLLMAFFQFGCGRKEALLRDLDSCRKELSSNQYVIEHLKEQVNLVKQEQEEAPVVEEAPPIPETNVDLWEAAYVDIAERIKMALDGVAHGLTVQRGALAVTLEADGLFLAGDDALNDEGSLVMRKMAVVLRTLDERKIFVTCRATDVTLVKKGVNATTNRELAVKRALAVLSSLEWLGVNPASLIAGGYNADDDMSSIGQVEVLILPRDEELPEFPKIF